ncbi:uncharacterized protein LOC100368436 [Saccoglossus kowalevskii]
MESKWRGAQYRSSWLFNWYSGGTTRKGKSTTRPDVGDNDAFTLSTFSQDKSGRTNSENEKDISLSEDNSQHLEGAKNENKLQQADGETEHWYGIVKNFANSTTAHGLSHVVSSVSWSSRLAWTIILLAAATAFITQTLMLIIQYMEFNVNTKVALVSATERPFPSITVCNTNKLRRSALLKSRYREMLIVDSPLVLPHYGVCSIEEDFICANGIYCIRKYLECDGVNHCLDMSDELHCTYAECGDGQFKCESGSNNGYCIDEDLVCDTKKHCYGGEDEDNCECKSNEFTCASTGRCIPNAFLCDDVIDCADGTDEINNFCVSEYPNVALGKPSQQSSDGRYGPEKAVDGYTETYIGLHSCSTTRQQYEPWWQVDLGDSYKIHQVHLYQSINYAIGELDGGELRIGYDAGNYSLNQQCGESITDATNYSVVTRNCNGIIGRYVSVSIPGRDSELVLCEVQIIASAVWLMNAALNKPTNQSSEMNKGPAPLAVDGIKSPSFWQHSCTHTELDNEPWWLVDLTKSYTIYHVTIVNRDDCCSERLSGAVVRVAADIEVLVTGEICGNVSMEDIVSSEKPVVVLICSQPLIGRYVSVQIENRQDYLNLCEVEVYATPLGLENVAMGKPAEQISMSSKGVASRAVDGNLNLDYVWGQSCIHTRQESEPWWRVDLLTQYRVYEIIFHNRGDCCWERTYGAVLRVGNSKVIKQNPRCGDPLTPDVIDVYSVITSECVFPLIGRYVSVQLEGRVEWMNFCEVQVMGEEYIDPGHVTFNAPLHFEEIRNRVLIGPKSVNISRLRLESCAYKCFTTKDFNCLSFNYEPSDEMCSLLVDGKHGDHNTTLKLDKRFSHYEQLQIQGIYHSNEGNCSDEHFHCGSGECLQIYKVCDVREHCIDGSDEFNCTSDDQKSAASDNWYEPFLDITSDEKMYREFLSEYHAKHQYHRVKGEDPPDWLGFKSYSLTPDYGDFDEILKIGKADIYELGHQGEDFITQCFFEGVRCNSSDFLVFQDEKYGNCFTFNNEGDQTVKKPGAKNGLDLTLFIEQQEYTSVYGMDAGVRVVILPSELTPMPQHDGFTIKPGSTTSIGMIESYLKRMHAPWGNCTYGKTEQVFNIDGFQNEYSLMACERACIMNVLEQYCGCTNSIHRNGSMCTILDEYEDRCNNLIQFFYRNDLLQCDCRQPCSETQYDLTISQTLWPSDIYLNHFLQNVHTKNSKTRTITDASSARSNFVHLEVYFQRLSYETTSEYKAYSWEDLLSDIGGTVGLYVGLSVITVCEFLKLFFELFKLCTAKKRKKKQTYDTISVKNTAV